MPFGRATQVGRQILWLLCTASWVLIAISVRALHSPAPRTTTSILDRPVTHLNFEDAEIRDVLKALQKQTGVQFNVDWAEIGRDSTVATHLHIESASLGDVLKVLFSPSPGGDGYALIKATENEVHVCRPWKQTRIYDVRDLADADREFHRTDPAPTPQGGSVFSAGSSALIPSGSPDSATMRLADLSVYRDADGTRCDVIQGYLIVTTGSREHRGTEMTLRELRRANVEGGKRGIVSGRRVKRD